MTSFNETPDWAKALLAILMAAVVFGLFSMMMECQDERIKYNLGAKYKCERLYPDRVLLSTSCSSFSRDRVKECICYFWNTKYERRQAKEIHVYIDQQGKAH